MEELPAFSHLPEIPPSIHGLILPNESLSISEFLDYPLPLTTGAQIEIKQYLSPLPPTITSAKDISQISLPPDSSLQGLASAATGSDFGYSKSILCLHAPGQQDARLPLWAITYWVQVSLLRPIHTKWNLAKKKLEDLRHIYPLANGGGEDLFSRVEGMLGLIGWSEKVQQPLGGGVTTKCLLPYFTKQWLTDEQENQMLHILQKQVAQDIEGSHIYIAETFFFENVKRAYTAAAKYPTDSAKGWLRERGQELACSSGTLATLVNINNNHWVAVVVDFHTSKIRYGDSLGGSVKQDVEEVLLWWTYQHTGKEFNTVYLPISRQKDGFSCGLLSWNALATYLLPQQHQLMDTKYMAAERLKKFLESSSRSKSEEEETHNSEDSEVDIKAPSNVGTAPRPSSPTSVGPPASPQSSATSAEPLAALLSSPTSAEPPTSPPVSSPMGVPLPTSLIPPPSPPGQRKSTILDYFKRGTKEDVKAYWDRQEEEAAARRSEQEELDRNYEIHKKRHERELTRLRVQKHRSMKKESEIQTGTRNADGKKRKIRDLDIEDHADDPLMKRIKGNVAEITRHERQTKEKLRQKNKKSAGRHQKPENAARPAKYHDWLTPLCWAHISIVAKQVGYQMSSTEIVRGLKRRDPVIFENISRSTVDGWIDRTGDKPCWRKEVRARIESGKGPGHNKGGPRGILSAYPDVVKAIESRLHFLRERGSPISLITARAIIVATILHMKPDILTIKFKDGSTFCASDTYVQRFLHRTMSWSLRKGTRVAQKMPKNWEDACEKSFLRKAYIIKEHDIPIDLYVNSDQTQVVYAPGNRMTWTSAGSNQVAIVGMEEKRAFTLMVSVAANGTLLPFQAIYVGLTKASLPSAASVHYEECINAGFLFEASGTKTYWSNQSTMKSFVNRILAPYFERKKQELGLPASQKSLWQIDVWSVHRSEEFRGWMRKTHPNIVLDFVPGGCTGVHQPCDVGIQRPLKLSMRKSYHEDIVNELFSELSSGNTEPSLKDALSVVRNRSVRWMWNAYNVINNKSLVQKAFEKCVVREWDLSYSCLTGFKARDALRSLRTVDPAFWYELTEDEQPRGLPGPDETVDEDNVPTGEKTDTATEDLYADDSDIPISTLIEAMHAPGNTLPATVGEREDGTLTSLADAENEDLVEAVPHTVEVTDSEAPGKRVRRPNQQYKEFWRH
ncbi:hypothetical protein D9613_012424 [Agrocybe pediades]|uniref:Ubiquitin-like protease family profile domain-containing protein n=1 Tax=Agrocybe pediades TaxID=84607 RepID=A0A8H4QQX6_9AGAR|nr:hypothetical protein D9613_012424 [Agrocybe pediades]